MGSFCDSVYPLSCDTLTSFQSFFSNPPVPPQVNDLTNARTVTERSETAATCEPTRDYTRMSGHTGVNTVIEPSLDLAIFT